MSEDIESNHLTFPDPWQRLQPKKLSPSRAKDYMQCPLAWKLKMIDKKVDPPNLATVRGTLTHQVLETLYKLPAHERTIERAFSLIPESWDACLEDHHSYSPWLAEWEGTVDDLFRIVRGLIEVYYRIENPTGALGACEQEKKFELQMRGVTIHGIIDRTDISGDGQVRIVDYKTGKKPSPDYEHGALWQLMFYALAHFCETGLIPARLRLVYLGERNGILEYAPTAEDIERFSDEVVALWAEIQRSYDSATFPPRTSPLCNWCNFQEVCPAKAGGQMRVA